jgi:hypothetical protein
MKIKSALKWSSFLRRIFNSRQIKAIFTSFRLYNDKYNNVYSGWNFTSI